MAGKQTKDRPGAAPKARTDDLAHRLVERGFYLFGPPEPEAAPAPAPTPAASARIS